MLPQANEEQKSQATTDKSTISCSTARYSTTHACIRTFLMTVMAKLIPPQQNIARNMLPHWPHCMFICIPVINITIECVYIYCKLMLLPNADYDVAVCVCIYVYTNTTLLWLAWTPLASMQQIMLHFYWSDAQLPWNADEAFNQSRVTACSHKRWLNTYMHTHT